MFVNLNTERLKIQPITILDASFIYDLLNTKDWIEFIGNRNIICLKDAENYILKINANRNYFYHTIFLKKTKKQLVF